MKISAIQKFVDNDNQTMGEGGERRSPPSPTPRARLSFLFQLF